MRHYAGMKVILCFSLCFAAFAWADEAADRAAIGRTIAALNVTPQSSALFTQDADAARELERLRKAEGPDFPECAAHPTVTISHEPWGEANIGFLCTLRI